MVPLIDSAPGASHVWLLSDVFLSRNRDVNVVTISGIELAVKIKKGQFKTGKLGGCDEELWNASLASLGCVAT